MFHKEKSTQQDILSKPYQTVQQSADIICCIQKYFMADPFSPCHVFHFWNLMCLFPFKSQNENKLKYEKLLA